MSVVTDDKAHINWANAYTCQIRKVHTNIQMVCEFFSGMGNGERGTVGTYFYSMCTLNFYIFCCFTLEILNLCGKFHNPLQMVQVWAAIFVFKIL